MKGPVLMDFDLIVHYLLRRFKEKERASRLRVIAKSAKLGKSIDLSNQPMYQKIGVTEKLIAV